MIVRIIDKCNRCDIVSETDDKRNIFYDSVDGDSVAEIISPTDKKIHSFLKLCSKCQIKTNHERYEKIIMLPDVLIIDIKRFKRNKYNRIIGKNSMEIDPSIVLKLDQAVYSLKGIVSHIGTQIHKG